MNENLSRLRNKYNRKLGELEIYKGGLEQTQISLSTLKKRLFRVEESQVILQIVAEGLQKQIKLHIEDLVDDGLDSILPKKYTFHLDFITKRNKIVSELYLMLGKNKLYPIRKSNGHGLSDVTSLILRIALLSLSLQSKQKKTNNLLALDEPLRNLSKDKVHNIALLLRKISHKFGIQIILCTHKDQAISNSDVVWKITNVNDESFAEKVV